MNLRIKKAILRLEQEHLDGLILSEPANISYLAEFRSRDSYLLLSKKESTYFTDSRYTEETKLKLDKYLSLAKINGSAFNSIARACLRLGSKRIGFEERHLPYAEYAKIKSKLGRKTDLIPTHGLIEEARQIKEAREIKEMRKAVKIVCLALEFIKGFLLPGMKETEVAGELERFVRQQGAQRSAFDIIVASGPNSSFPHHITSNRRLRTNEPVLIDLGADSFGYNSDLTRVFFLGKMSVLHKKIYAIVSEAQKRAIKEIKPQVVINKVDTASRNYIKENGYAEFFGHNLGHGIGLNVHEEPHISSNEAARLMPGMVFTVEPAIYLPGKFGVRIEDMALVTKEGCEVLSGSLNK